MNIEYIILYMINRKGTVSSSHFFHQLFTRLGIFNSIEDTLEKMANKKLLTIEGYFDNTGLMKNITITDDGKAILLKQDMKDVFIQIRNEFGDSETLQMFSQSIKT